MAVQADIPIFRCLRWYAALVSRVARVFSDAHSSLCRQLGVAAVNASVFGFYGLANRMLLENPTDSPTLTQITIAGTASGVFTSRVVPPCEETPVQLLTFCLPL